ncbi:hypothetical protein EYF80_045637 [Liparis tanakae]|uniref:Uncharacterized protein n=1 Tax=Liparis tanakae TaxID=230148 RepID=A0A4Z2FSE6_9TELE|nr:hypothetical protein EYF80_045637 [Liparis tanakae]
MERETIKSALPIAANSNLPQRSATRPRCSHSDTASISPRLSPRLLVWLLVSSSGCSSPHLSARLLVCLLISSSGYSLLVSSPPRLLASSSGYSLLVSFTGVEPDQTERSGALCGAPSFFLKLLFKVVPFVSLTVQSQAAVPRFIPASPQPRQARLAVFAERCRHLSLHTSLPLCS